MNQEQDLITIGYHKGEMDFGVNCVVGNLTLEQMQDMRSMIPVAIGIAEDMWRRQRQKEHPCGEQINQLLDE